MELWFECKNSIKDRVWNPSICDCVIVEYLKNYVYIKTNDSIITFDEIIDVAAKSYIDTKKLCQVILLNIYKYIQSHSGQLSRATSNNPSVVNTICIRSFRYTHVITSRKLQLK